MCSLTPWAGENERPSEGKVLIAHRGASAYAPEHTLEAYRLALEHQADFVEQDLQITKDGVLICLHDRTLQRTTNVEDVFPERFRQVSRNGKVSREWFAVDFTLAELKNLDAGSWFDPEHHGARIITFQEAIDLIQGKAGLYPELKDTDFYRQEGLHMEKLLLDVLEANRLDQPPAAGRAPVVIQSFSESSLRRLRFDLGCKLPLTYLLDELGSENGLPEERVREIKEFADGVGPNKECILEDPKLIERAHAAGLTVTPYTFRAAAVPTGFQDVQSEMKHFLYGLKVDALFTDNPDQFPRHP